MLDEVLSRLDLPELVKLMKRVAEEIEVRCMENVNENVNGSS